MRHHVALARQHEAEDRAGEREQAGEQEQVVEGRDEGRLRGVEGRRPGLAGGARAGGRHGLAEPAGTRARRSDSPDSMLLWKTAPSAATPVAIPTWRKVVLMPEPMPAFAAGTTPTATVAIAGFVSPDPGAGDEEAGEQRRPARVRR